MRSITYLTVALAVTAAATSACATKKFVRTEVSDVNTKVNTLSTSLEATQERTRRNETKIGEVDTKADAAARAAAEARAVGDASVTAGKDLDTRLTGAMNDIQASARRMIFEVTLSEDEGHFRSGRTAMPTEAKTKLDGMVAQMMAHPKNSFIEIEGYTDNVGASSYNEQLGLERAEAVKRYLHEQHQMPLHKMNVISYGEEKPVAPNATRAGRALNRRVVVRVLS